MLMRVLLFLLIIYGAKSYAQVALRQMEIIGFNTKDYSATSKLSYNHPEDMTCVPLAILNSLRLSRPVMASHYNAIKGKTHAEQATEMINLAEKVEPQVRKDGMYLSQFIPIINSLVPNQSAKVTLTPLAFNRYPNESSVEYVERIHSLLKGSIVNGVAPVISINRVSVERNKNKTFWDNENATRHALTVSAIQSHIDETKHSFLMEIIDPDDGLVKTIFVQSPINSTSFNASVIQDFKSNNTPQKIWSGDIGLERPFLIVEGPELDLGARNIEWSKRSINILTYGVGLFSNNSKSGVLRK